MSHLDMPREKLPLRWRICGWALFAVACWAAATLFFMAIDFVRGWP